MIDQDADSKTKKGAPVRLPRDVVEDADDEAQRIKKATGRRPAIGDVIADVYRKCRDAAANAPPAPVAHDNVAAMSFTPERFELAADYLWFLDHADPMAIRIMQNVLNTYSADIEPRPGAKGKPRTRKPRVAKPA